MLAFFSAIVGAVGAVSGIFGAKKQADAQADQARAQAKIAKKNAELVDDLMLNAIFRGRRQQQDVVTEGRAVVGRQRAAMGASHLDLTTGSPLDLVYNTQVEFMRDKDTAARNTEEELLDLRREKVNYTASAEGSRAAASNYRTAGTINAIASGANSFAQLMKPGGAWANIT